MAAERQRERRKQREEHLIKRHSFPTRLTIHPIAGVSPHYLHFFIDGGWRG
jgi:hypothetical protein